MVAAEVMYHVLEAKFMSESDDGVGKHTKLGILAANGQHISLTDIGIANVRDAWERAGKPRIPAGLLGAMEENLVDLPGVKYARSYSKQWMDMVKKQRAAEKKAGQQ
jgi:hypothetical protein